MNTATAIVLLLGTVGVLGGVYVITQRQGGALEGLFGKTEAKPAKGTSIGLAFNYDKFGS